MPIRTTPDGQIRYILIAYDKHGQERPEQGELLSERACREIATEGITDVFIVSHGWKGDIPEAIAQYDRWSACMAACGEDLARIRKQVPGFKPLIVGYHWPSLPWGEEELGGASLSFSEPAVHVPDLAERYMDRIADTPAAEAAIRRIIGYAAKHIAPPTLSPDIVEAFHVVNQESQLGVAGEGAPPGQDRDTFDPEFLYHAGSRRISFGSQVSGGVLFPLRQLSFWSMKERARRVGERASSELLRPLQEAAERRPRFHLIGHSFGCIVVSAMLLGCDLIASVDSVVLVQGAMSLWSCCPAIPRKPGAAGYFTRILQEARVNGPIVTTQSMADTAVCRLYPIAAGVARQFRFAPGEYPLYGAVGEFGLQGAPVETVRLMMHGTEKGYAFQPGKIYNLQASEYIRDGRGPAGAHNDIARPEVAHAVWEAAFPQGDPTL